MKEKLSALLDGDLEEHSVRTTLEGLRRDGTLRKDWEAYCLIGDALRGECAVAPDFVSRVMASIESEPTVIAPGSAAAMQRRRSVWQALLPVAASVMGVAAVGWVASALYSGEKSATPVVAVQRLASTPIASAAVPAATVRAPVEADAEDRHREYVFAHQAMTAGGPIPGVVQYVRTVSDSRQDARQ